MRTRDNPSPARRLSNNILDSRTKVGRIAIFGVHTVSYTCEAYADEVHNLRAIGDRSTANCNVTHNVPFSSRNLVNGADRVFSSPPGDRPIRHRVGVVGRLPAVDVEAVDIQADRVRERDERTGARKRVHFGANVGVRVTLSIPVLRTCDEVLRGCEECVIFAHRPDDSRVGGETDLCE